MTTNNLQFTIPVIKKPDLPHLEQNTVSWLRQLGRASWIDIPGIDNSRYRVISTLLHGNEPSGLTAIHRWLQRDVTPAVNIRFLIASVEAALREPIFSQRMQAGQRDLNRCFKEPFHDRQGLLAQQVIETIAHLQPECVIDIHNTSGSGPSFAVAIENQFEQRALAGFFCRRMIVTDLRLNSLMEVETGCPTITIECGGARDDESENVAFSGIGRVTSANALFPAELHYELEILHHPVRVVLNPGVSVTYSDRLSEDVDITLWPDIEHCNYGTTPRSRCLGWVGPGGLRLLQAENTAGVNRLTELLREQDGWLYPARDLHLFMATTNPRIARDDCLFYAVSAGT